MMDNVSLTRNIRTFGRERVHICSYWQGRSLIRKNLHFLRPCQCLFHCWFWPRITLRLTHSPSRRDSEECRDSNTTRCLPWFSPLESSSRESQVCLGDNSMYNLSLGSLGELCKLIKMSTTDEPRFSLFGIHWDESANTNHQVLRQAGLHARSLRVVYLIKLFRITSSSS